MCVVLLQTWWHVQLSTVTDRPTDTVALWRRNSPLDMRNISWQILGISQHIVGDLHGALQSYRESLRQKPRHRTKNATEIRIGLVLQQLRKNNQHWKLWNYIQFDDNCIWFFIIICLIKRIHINNIDENYFFWLTHFQSTSSCTMKCDIRKNDQQHLFLPL